MEESSSLTPPALFVLVGLLLVLALVALLVGRRLRQFEVLLQQQQQRSSELQQQIELKDYFVSVVSHEMRTPLTALRSVLQLAVEKRLPPARQQELLTLALEQADRLSRLIHDLLDLQQLGRGMEVLRMAPVNLVLVAQSALLEIQPVATPHGVRLRLDAPSPSDMPTVLADEDRLRQVFCNLLSNAVRYTPPGDEVVVRVRADPAMVRCNVVDTGPGIPPDLLPRLFEPFAVPRQHTDSIGLGLAIAQKIVQLHGGNIGAVSPVVDRGGSMFWFTIPTTDGEGRCESR